MPPAPAGPSVWAVSDGRIGIERQSLSIAWALAEPDRAARLAHVSSDAHRTEPLRLSPRGLQTVLPPHAWPAPLAALDAAARCSLSPPWPDVWIATGRRSIPYSRLVRQASGGRTLVVQTQHPRSPLSTFDLVVPPLHDGLAGTNVFPILGPPTWFPDARVAAALSACPHLADEPGPRVLVSIGGASRTHRLDAAAAERIAGQLDRLAGGGATLWITVSRRTPDEAKALLRAVSARTRSLYWESEARDGPNPYLAWLASCDAALVTEDSANMLADPAFFGKPVHLLRMSGGSPRFDRLHQGFIAAGHARWFDGTLETRPVTPLREAARVADRIVEMLLAR